MAAQLQPADRERLDRLRDHVDEVLDDVIPACSKVALLGWGYDGNVGNHMMWIAVTDYLRGRGIRIAFASHLNNLHLDRLASAIGDGPVLFLGGVTMSGLWGRHRDARRVVAERLPNNQIVSLASTTLYTDDDDREAAGATFTGHGRTTLIARDHRSLRESAEVVGDDVDVVFSHDAAFRLPTQPARRGTGIAWLRRDDLEAKEFATEIPLPTFDWSNDLATEVPSAYRWLRLSGVASRLRATPLGGLLGRPINAFLVWTYGRVARDLLDRGNEILDEAAVLVTDRMHPHVLCVLRDQPVVLLPDKFGKNRAVFEASTGEFSRVHWADDVETAHALALELLDEATAS